MAMFARPGGSRCRRFYVTVQPELLDEARRVQNRRSHPDDEPD